jgi:MFS family permease
VRLARFRTTLRTPGVTRVLITSLVARLPLGMASLGILLLVTRHHGYARAGLVTGLYVAAAGVSNIALSRAADRYGARAVLTPAAIGYAAAMTVLGLVPQTAYDVELVVAVLSGLSSPPVVSVVRGLWPRILDPVQAQAVYGVEASLQEIVFIAGPALVALIAAAAGAPSAVVATGALGLAGTLGCVASPALRDVPRVTARRDRRRLRGVGLPAYMLAGFALVLAFNMTEIGVVAFVSGRQASASSGGVLAAWSFGSFMGGLWFGAGSSKVDDLAVLRGLLTVAAGVAVSAAASGVVVLAVLLFGGGMAIAPALARLYSRVGTVAPEGTSTEAFSWVAVGLLAGAAVGAVLGGVCVQHIGARATLLLSAAAPTLVAIGLAGWARDRTRASDHPLPS